MAHAFTPGLTVSENALVRVGRSLPLEGGVLVRVGDAVDPDTTVARADLPGSVRMVNLAAELGLSPAEVRSHLLVPLQASVRAGDVLAARPGVFGFKRAEVRSPVDGLLESVSEITGQAVLREPPRPVTIKAHVRGRVVHVEPGRGALVEARGALIQGIFGVGGETHGPLRVAVSSQELELGPAAITAPMAGAIVVGGARLTLEAYRAAARLGVRALVVGSIDDRDLREILGYDLGVAVTGQEAIDATIIVTEGFGAQPMADRTFELLHRLEGREASVNGATQIRAGVIRPQIVVPLEVDASAASPSAPVEIIVGSPVRIIREPWFGRLGEVSLLPPEPMPLETEAHVRVVEVLLRDGARVLVPRANVEIVG
ncbi:MAG: hypothetical protein AB1486_13505 [Planctomycetota bacterium]